MLTLKRKLYKDGKLVIHRSGKKLANAVLDGTVTDEEMQYVPSDDFFKDLFNAIVWTKTD